MLLRLVSEEAALSKSVRTSWDMTSVPRIKEEMDSGPVEPAEGLGRGKEWV